jgi:uncharacterized protein (TIGR03032 family)
LAQARGVLSADNGAPDVVDLVPTLHPAAGGWASGRLTADDVTAEAVEMLTQQLVGRGRDRDDRPSALTGDSVLVIDQSPLHALRVPFLAAAFPGARFVYVHRDVTDSVAGSLNAWLAQRSVAYPRLPGWAGPGWTGPLVPQWRELTGRALQEVVGVQWRAAIATLIADLDELAGERWAVVSHEQLVADPQREITRLCTFLGIDWDRTLTAPLLGRAAREDSVGPGAIVEILPLVADAAAAAADLVAVDDSPVPAPVTTPLQGPFGSNHTLSFPGVLSSLGVSLLVSTYQSGRLILCRADGNHLNSHFRMLPVPMGIAVDATRVSVGTERRIVTYRNHPSAVPQLGDEKYDGCLLPLHVHVTGNIQVHELAYVEDELWAVSTRFSCLVTFDDDHSFVPRWRPPFISALAAEDRCHLNGFAAVEGRIAFASALGLTDSPGGWRDAKGTGGVVLDVPSGEVVLSGLSMPHSPRWYDGRLWVLESGKGALVAADPVTGQVETVVELPGFTRGLTFVGHYAFVGLSQVRESVFRGLPILERQERKCGVWIVDVRTGAVVGNLEFTGAVQEIFDVQVLPWRWPELGELDGELLGRSFVIPA